MATKLRFDEINALDDYLRTIKKEQGTLKEIDPDYLVDTVLDILIMEYVFGVEQANESIGSSVQPNTEKMKSAIYKKIDGKTFEDRVREYVGADDVASIIRVAETDGTRAYNDGVLSAGIASGMNVMKRWETMLDNRVRDTHSYLQGMTVPLTDRFYTFDGDSAMYPTDFADPANNCNCRCYIDLVAV